MKELKQVLSFIKKSNPYSEEGSWFDFIDMIVKDVKDNTVTIKESITNWLDKLIYIFRRYIRTYIPGLYVFSFVFISEEIKMQLNWTNKKTGNIISRLCVNKY